MDGNLPLKLSFQFDILSLNTLLFNEKHVVFSARDLNVNITELHLPAIKGLPLVFCFHFIPYFTGMMDNLPVGWSWRSKQTHCVSIDISQFAVNASIR